MQHTTLIVALDFPSEKETLAFLDHFEEAIYVKVGMELFYREGPRILEKIKVRGHQIFLDLKLHDIPNTVKSAMRNLAMVGVDMVNLHAAGGRKMMEAAVEGLESGSKAGQRPLCIAVTQLTSTGDQMLREELLIREALPDVVLHYAKVAEQSGMDGVVCSVHEARRIHDACGERFLTITPGIRPAGASKDDQVRIATPAFAREQGSDFIVVGRPITQAEDQLQAYKTIAADL